MSTATHPMEIIIKQNITEVSEYLGDLLVQELKRILALQGKADVVLAGGSTFMGAYALMPQAENIDWPHVQLFFGDERCVAPADPRSNYGQSAQVWWERLPLDNRPVVHRVHGEEDPISAAQAYAGLLPDSFDIVLLGMGPDGHTASLFPGSLATVDPQQRVVVTQAELSPQVTRITMTPETLNRGTLTVIAAIGVEKAEPVAKLLTGEAQNDCPVSLMRGNERTVVVLDKDAASKA